MKRIAKMFGWMSFAAALLLFPRYSWAETLGTIRVNIVEGDVQVKISETGEWVPASVNMPLVEGDELWVPDGSRAALQSAGGNYLRLDEGTALQVLRVGIDSSQFYLSEGRGYVLNRAPKNSVLQLDTPDASIRAFGNAAFRIDIPGGETDVSVFRGSVETENEDGTSTVRAGAMLAVGANGFAELSPVSPPDEWQKWNARQDRIVLARGKSYGYLPEELRAYSSDFDGNGRWVNVPEYGNIWTPTVVANNDWAPYRHGRWVWRGGDYVWVGYEPWGWAPYHYGRWAFVPRVGWAWVPPGRGDVYWSPGYVGWVRTGDHVAWVPLAPRETYYGYGNHGRYSSNVTNVNVTQVRVTNVYVNAHVTNGITVVNQTTFITGRPSSVDRSVVVNVRKDFEKHRNIVVGRPPITPAESSYHPVFRSIPEARRPPPAVRRIDARELRQARPMIKEQNRSAFRPQGKPAPLEVKTVEKPRPASERAKERPKALPKEQRGPGGQQGSPPESVERAKPKEAEPKGKAPPERGKPEPPPSGRPQAPPERVNPEPPPNRPPAKAEQPFKKKEPEPKEKPVERTQPKDRVMPEPPPSRPPAKAEQPFKKKEPESKAKPVERTPPQERVKPEPPPNRPPAKAEQPFKAKEAEPKAKPAERTPPQDRVKPDPPPNRPPAKAEQPVKTKEPEKKAKPKEHPKTQQEQEDERKNRN